MKPPSQPGLFEQYFAIMEVVREDPATNLLTPAEEKARNFLLAHYTELPGDVRPLVLPLQYLGDQNEVGRAKIRSILWQALNTLKHAKASETKSGKVLSAWRIVRSWDSRFFPLASGVFTSPHGMSR